MSRRTAILTLARAGATADAIAAQVDTSRKYVLNACSAQGVPVARRAQEQFEGVVVLRAVLLKWTGAVRYEMVMPVSALRAAGLDTQTKLAYRVVGETVIFERVTQGELR